ncbi:MAG: hypothetical protein GXP60_03610 [Epsilonproteobacteria bacterium]|nr:hypothetical protein [Campylobacterota bacterium]
MKKDKLILYTAMFAVVVIVLAVFLYVRADENSRYGIFPAKLADMSIVLYEEGKPAISAIQRLHGGIDMHLKNAFIADYEGSSGNKVKFWVSKSKNNRIAKALLATMTGKIGKTGMFSKPIRSNIGDLTVYYVAGLGKYHYIWIKGDRVFWLQINNPSKVYQRGIVRKSENRVK